PITWQLVSGNATLVGNILTPKNKGAIVLRATQGGNATFEPATIMLNLEAKEKHDDRLVNLSSRLRVTGGDASRTVVAGFVVNGTTPKRVLIRGIGPGLTAFGVPNVLADPILKLYASPNTTTPLAQNDNWGTAQPVNATQTPATAAEITAATTATGAFPL